MPDYENFGCQTKLCLSPRKIPDLSWKWADTVHTQDIGHVTVSNIFHLDEVLNLNDVDTILVNSDVYTRPTADLCTTTNACKTMVSSYETPCKLLQAM